MGRCWPVALTRLCAAIAVVYSVRGELARTREMEAKLPAPSRRPSAPRSPSPSPSAGDAGGSARASAAPTRLRWGVA